MRLSNLEELAEREVIFSRLQRSSGSTAASNQQSQAQEAPASAFLDAPTIGLAGSQFQTYVTGIVREQSAVLVSVGIVPPVRDEPPDTIRIEASLDLTLKALQNVLYQLESGTPYVFVESMAVRLTSLQREAEDPLLRVTLNLRAVLRRRSA
jgi:hypothetical protein